MQYKDYKINRIRERGTIKRYFVSFFQGEMEQVERKNEFGEIELVTIYKRGPAVKTKNYKFRSTQSEKEILAYLNKQLIIENGKLTAKNPVTEQRLKK